MAYEIHYTAINDSKVGVEVRPPLTPEAVVGIFNELSYVPGGFSNESPIADTANVTRQDGVGTAMAIRLNTFSGLGALKLALLIGRTIDPCGVAAITYHEHSQS